MFKPNGNLIEILKERNLYHQSIPETESLLQKEMVTGYIGFDPTADSLHIGNLIPVFLLKHLQNCGHKPIALVGGATGLVGDPSGKNAERQLLDLDALNHNLNAQKHQLEKFLNFDTKLKNNAEIVNNYDWFKDIGFLEFIRDIGKHISVNYMMAKDSVKNRLETGLSFTEFSYQLVQGYDFYWLYTNKNCKLQMGGSDQWGNIVTGTELIRRKSQGDAYAITAPLLTKSDGSKFGKSEAGNIWLDPAKTSPFKFYQFWLNIADEEAEKIIKIFTLLSLQEINEIIAQHYKAPHLRLLQKTLAKEMTCFIHGQNSFEQCQEATDILFGKKGIEAFELLDSQLLQAAFEGVPTFAVSKNDINLGIGVLDLLVEKTQIFESKGEARKMIKNNGLRINKKVVQNQEIVIDDNFLVKNQFIIVQKGKKNYNLIQIQ